MKLPDWIDKRRQGDTGVVDTFRQWQTGLLGCLPGWLRSRLDPALGALILQLGEQGDAVLYRRLDQGARELGRISVEDPNAGQLLKTLIKDAAAAPVLRLPAGWVLEKKVSLPAAARDNLRQVIGFELDRLTPFTADQVCYDFKVDASGAKAANLSLVLGLVPRSRIGPWLTLLERTGISLSAIDAAGFWQGMNLLPPDARPRISRRDLVANGLAGLLFLALLIAALGVPLWQKRAQVMELGDRVAVARRQAEVARKLQEQLQRSSESLDFVVARRAASPPVVEVLSRVTELVPDHTWLQQFTLEGGQLQLRGMSDQATVLIHGLEGSPGFTDVGFRSPVIQASGKERFHLSARVLNPGEGQ